MSVSIHVHQLICTLALTGSLLAGSAGFADGDGRGEHWAFSPPSDPPLPTVDHVTWCSSPLDRYVLAKLELRGIETADPADFDPSPEFRSTWLAAER